MANIFIVVAVCYQFHRYNLIHHSLFRYLHQDGAVVQTLSTWRKANGESILAILLPRRYTGDDSRMLNDCRN